MPGRASIVGAAATHVGKVREHNEDAHFFDADGGLFIVCDGMGGHAAGEVASGIAIRVVRQRWSADDVQTAIDDWLEKGTPEAKKSMLAAIREAARSAHDAIISEAAQDEEKSGMGTTFVGAIAVGNELVFAHAGDSRAYIVRDNIAMQLTEDHTLLSRLLAAGIDVDVSGEGARFRSMLTNALGIGQDCKISTFVVPLADGDRFLLCSDGISEYVPEPEIGKVLSTAPSPARAAQKLIDLALERGGADNATAVVIRVLEAGETPQPVELRRKDDGAIQACALWDRVSPQQRLRALRIALSRDVAANERLPAHTLGERVAWIIIEGEIEHGQKRLGPGALLYPESLIKDTPAPDRDSLAITRSDVRGLVLRADDFHELCEDDPELAELLHETLGKLVTKKRGGVATQPGIEEDIGRMPTLDPDAPQQERRRSRAETSELIEPPPPVAPPLPITIPDDDAPTDVRDVGGLDPSPAAQPGPRPIPKLQIPSVLKAAAPGSTPARGVPKSSASSTAPGSSTSPSRPSDAGSAQPPASSATAAAPVPASRPEAPASVSAAAAAADVAPDSDAASRPTAPPVPASEAAAAADAAPGTEAAPSSGPAAASGPSRLPAWAMSSAASPATPPAAKSPSTSTSASTPHTMTPKSIVPIPATPVPKVVSIASSSTASLPVASSLDQVRIPTPPSGIPKAIPTPPPGSLKRPTVAGGSAVASTVIRALTPSSGTPKLVVSERSPQIDLGSELRADLGGDHAVPKKRPSAPKIETRAPTPEPVAEEPEIEEVVELEAEAPGDEDEDEVEMTVVEGEGDGDEPTVSTAAAIGPDEEDVDEATVTVVDDGARVTETVTDSEATMTPSEEGAPKPPIRANETVVVSGTIKIPDDDHAQKPRSKRLSDGWEE